MLLTDKVSQFTTDSNLVHAWVHGTDVVMTEGGPVRSPAKLIADKDAEINLATLNLPLLAGSAGASLVGHMPAGTGAVATSVQAKLRESVSVKDFGAVGDGVADDFAPLVNAAASAVSAGGELHLDGTKTYMFGLTLGTSQIVFPPGLRLKTNGAQFIAAYSTDGNADAVIFSANTVVDEFNLTIPSGVRRDRAIQTIGSDVTIGKLHVESKDVQTTAESNDRGVRISTGSGVKIGSISVTNYDRAVIVDGTTSSTIGAVIVNNYVRGLWVYDNVDLTIGQTSIKTRSPNASNEPGHNGIILSCNTTNAQRNVTINDAVVEDSGEHGIRVGGNLQQINITFNNPHVYNAGNCGIKLLGTDSTVPTAKNRNIVINSPVIEDCGTSASAATNRCGILIEYVIGCQVISPTIKVRNNLTSCAYGISINASSFVHVTNPIIEKASLSGVLIDNRTVNSSNEHITFDGGRAQGCGGSGIELITQNTFVNNFVIFNGTNLISNGGVGFSSIVVGTGNPTQLIFRVQCQLNTGGAGVSNTIRTILDGVGAMGATPLSGITAGNGSTWNDGVTLNLRKGGAWVAL